MTIHIELTKKNLMKAPKLIVSKVFDTAKVLKNKRVKIIDISV